VGRNPDAPEAGLVPLLAVATFRGDELKLIDPVENRAIQGPNVAFPLAVPTLARPAYLASGSLGDGMADLLVVASAGTEVQLIGTWLDGTEGFGVVATWDLAPVAGNNAQVLSMVVTGVPTGAPTGAPPVAPVATGRAWIVLGMSDPQDLTRGQIVVLEVQRVDGGEAIQLSGAPAVRGVPFSPMDLAAAPDHIHLYVASLDPVERTAGGNTFGVAEFDMSAGATGAWPMRPLDARGAGTFAVAAAFVGERSQLNFYNFDPPALRVYAALDASGCGAERDIACGVATFDPARGGLAADPAPAGPAGWPVTPQSYRTPLFVPSIPIALGIAMPPAIPAPEPPSAAFGSQVCYSPAQAGVDLPLCPSVTEVAGSPPFNAVGAPQRFMLQAPPTGQLWTSVVGMVTGIDGNAYVQDLGRFGPVNAVSMLNDDLSRTQANGATTVGPAGPTPNSALFGFPANTSALGLWLDVPPSPEVVSDPDDLAKAIGVWPGFTKDDRWLVSYQGVLPGLAQRRAVVGLTGDGSLYLAIQDAAVIAPDGVLPANSYWVPGAYVERPEIGIHTVVKDGAPGDIGQFLLDVDPCPSTRPNWIPSGSTTPVYDPTIQPLAHETVVLDTLAPDATLYPGGALKLAPAADATLAQEYACLVAWLQRPENAGQVLTIFRNSITPVDYARGAWVRAGGLLLVGASAGYAGRPQLDVGYDFAWSDEGSLTGEALVLARKARRFYYPSAYPDRAYANYPGMTDPMQPGPVLRFRVGRYCPPNRDIPGCDPTTSPPARDTGVDFFTVSGLSSMQRRPTGSSGGNWVTSFDKSTIPGQEYVGRVFYATFVGDMLMMVPPGLDVGQSVVLK
jgi:hypothetical protein